MDSQISMHSHQCFSELTSGTLHALSQLLLGSLWQFVTNFLPRSGRRLSEEVGVISGESSGFKEPVFKNDVANLDHGGIAVLENSANS